MNNFEESGKNLADLAWEDSHRIISGEISGWGERKHSGKSKSLDFKSKCLRPKLMLPRYTKVRNHYQHIVYSPQPVNKTAAKEDEKIGNFILKLLEKSRQRAKGFKISSTSRFGNKIVTKIPFLNYKLNLPRSFNTLKTPSALKSAKKKKIYSPLEKSFAYKLTGTPLLHNKIMS